MNRSLREVLGESYIAAVAIAVLLFWSLDSMFWTMWWPCYRIAEFLVEAVAIGGIPYASPTITLEDRIMLSASILYLCGALGSLAAAWVLSRWVYGVGPLRALMQCRARLARRNDA